MPTWLSGAAARISLIASLRRKGFKIVARNYRLGSGDAEADVIGWHGEELVFVEVKTRRSAEHGPPDRAVGEDKREHLRRVAREYARKSNTPLESVRFDLVSVILTNPPQLEWLPGAQSNRAAGSNGAVLRFHRLTLQPAPTTYSNRN